MANATSRRTAPRTTASSASGASATSATSNAAQAAIIGLLKTADLVRTRFTEVVARQGITLQQFNVLRILRGAGAQGLPTLEIGERMIERAPGITRLLDRLERKGWIRRERCRHDRRRVFCQITADGLELLAHLDRPIADADAAAVAGLSEEQQRRLLQLLDRFRGGLPPVA